jgi:PAS domain S-box-containing protein
MSHSIISSISGVPVIYYESAILISGAYIMDDHIDIRKKSTVKIEDLHQKIDELEERLARFERIEEALRESEERYRSVIDNVEVGIALISPTMEIVSLNNQMRKWFPLVEVGAKPICYRAFNDPPRDSVCSYCPTHKTLSDGKVHQAVTSTPSGGKVRYFKIIASPLRNKRGEVVAAIEMVEDITRKKRSEVLLKKERKIFFSVLQKAPYGAVIIDKKGSYLYINEEFSKVTGYSLQDIPRGIDWFLKAYPDPRYRKSAMKAWKEDISSKGITRAFTIRCKTGEDKEIEFRSTRLDGARYLLMLSDVTERKRAEMVLLKARDDLELRIRERTDELVKINSKLQQENVMRKKIEEALKEREARLTAIIGASDGLIYICSKDFIVEFMNERLIKRTGYDATGELCFKVLHDRDSVCTWCVNEQVFKGETVRWEVQSPKDDKWWYIINTPIYHADGSISKHAMILDITERKKAEEEITRLNRDLEENIAQLKTVNAELETFSYSISHDLKTPVIAVEGFSRILFEKYADQLDGKGKKIVSMISGSALQMRELIDDLLAFFTLGRKNLKLSTLDLGKIVNEIFDQLRAVHQGRAMQLSINPSPAVSADKTMIRQVILNLLSNAIKYSRIKMITTVEFGGWIEAGLAVYYIKDNGIGFPMEQVGRLFEVFERLHPPDEFEGTGIGLATVKRIVQRHGGEVWAQSKVNEGATFYFSIPTHS